MRCFLLEAINGSARAKPQRNRRRTSAGAPRPKAERWDRKHERPRFQHSAEAGAPADQVGCAASAQVARAKDPQRSRITNCSALLPGVDGRSAWVRRAKDLLVLHMADLGGEDNVSEAERALLRRAVTLIVELERREVMFAQAGAADDDALAIYQTTVNTLRRTLESLGLQRRPRDVSPTLGQILRAGQRDL